MLSRLPKNLSHRRRMSPLSRSRLPFSSLMACCPSVFLPPRPAIICRCLYKPLIMSRCRRSVSSSATYSSKWASIPLSIAARTSLHAARSAFHVAVVCLVLHCRRASRFFSSAAKSAALTAGRSHHPSLCGVRLASGRTACAAPRMASVNSLTSSATLARWLAGLLSRRYCRRISGSRAPGGISSSAGFCRMTGVAVSAVHGGCGQIVPQGPRWQTPCCGPSPL